MTQVSGGMLWLGEGNLRGEKKCGRGLTGQSSINYNKQELTRRKCCKPVEVPRGKKKDCRKISTDHDVLNKQVSKPKQCTSNAVWGFGNLTELTFATK